MEGEDIPVLVHFGQHAKKMFVKKSSGKMEILEKCAELFPETESFFLQIFDDEFEEWVDIGDTTLIVKKTVLKMFEKEERPSKRAAGASSSSDDERGKSLLQKISNIKKKFKTKQSTKPKKTKPVDVTVQMGWLHFNMKKKEYTQVRAIKGGGTTTVRTNRYSTIQEIIELGTNMFFQNGNSIFGKLDQMSVHLADYRANVIDTEDWRLDNILEAGVKVRLYLCSKLIKPDHQVLSPLQNLHNRLKLVLQNLHNRLKLVLHNLLKLASHNLLKLNQPEHQQIENDEDDPNILLMGDFNARIGILLLADLKKINTPMAFLDFRKAFDSVWLNGLFKAVWSSGV
ncbi:uncharacterized protein [Antedon mediterranea]|uniref:uncharacterized protein n=1 Tax=Antedon mediterranea TaxID=105859 RepID=UPI003AF683DF